VCEVYLKKESINCVMGDSRNVRVVFVAVSRSKASPSNHDEVCICYARRRSLNVREYGIIISMLCNSAAYRRNQSKQMMRTSKGICRSEVLGICLRVGVMMNHGVDISTRDLVYCAVLIKLV